MQIERFSRDVVIVKHKKLKVAIRMDYDSNTLRISYKKENGKFVPFKILKEIKGMEKILSEFPGRFTQTIPERVLNNLNFEELNDKLKSEDM